MRHKTASVSGECTLSGPLFVEQLEVAHSSYMIDFPNAQNDDGKKYHLFVGLNKVSPDGKSGDFYFTVLWTDEGVATDPDHFWTRTASKEDLQAFVRRITADLPQKFRRTIDETTVEGMLARQITIYTLILDEHALPAGRVTLLGDAAREFFFHPLPVCRSPLGRDTCYTMLASPSNGNNGVAGNDGISRQGVAGIAGITAVAWGSGDPKIPRFNGTDDSSSNPDAMTPFRGEGGCHAMQDGLNLARAVASIQDKEDAESIKTVLGAYQKEMLKRGSKAAQLSDTQLDEERPRGMFVQPLPKDQVVI